MMSTTFATIFVLAISYVTMCTAYEDDKEPIWNFDDILSQRSHAEKQQDRDESSEILKFALPGVHPTKDSPFSEVNTVAIKPLVDMHTVHHLMIVGCSEPANYAFANDGKYWTCGESGLKKCSHGSTDEILYAWGRNAPELDLPPDTAIEVGGKSDHSYLVLEVHYASVDKFLADPTLKDYAGAELHMTSVRPSQLAAVFLLQPFGDIPPKKKAWHFDIGCQYHDGPVLHPFDFRVHTHGIGTVVTGYRIRDGKWTLIGKMDPQRPQAFYPVDNLVDIKSGDTIKCIYLHKLRDSISISVTRLTHEDEMCNFYMMYWYDPKQGKAASNHRDFCQLLDPKYLDYPADSDVPLPTKRAKLAMK
ncbi:Peptidyl-glycine alpha-amidating monooxygenase [Stylophora pistillata]|uniref:peptidylglycine monooxygenase n=1 Tax=Stylophora pistillata TaxID=50429 RepID=A0A2B4T246_STYPI|nr:Peptidyl-glycine alpha-amidating monooxygenase [Stylophora pistillata]